MADITMCSGGECPLKNVCYRYTAPINEYRQSWSDFTDKVVVIDGIPECHEFIFDSRAKQP